FKDILDKYNFTVTEDTPFDREIAIDPEMLGLIYESIVNEEERSGSGIFYTPRIEVDFMCKKSLLHYFCSNTQITQEKLIDLIFGESTEPDGISPASFLSLEEKKKILSELNDLNVLDPACGSGAFLIGMLQNILKIIEKVDELDLEELYRTEPDYLYNRKKELIEKIIHGVDIKPWAAQLAELRLWLYLIWDFETSIENLTKKPLLPSLEFKIRQGDSLLSEIEGNPIILRNIGENYLFPDIYTKVHHIIDLKEKYYQHEDDTITKKKVENAEKELIAHILYRKRMALSKKLGDMYGEGKVAEPQHLFEVTEQQKLNFLLAVEKLKKEQDEIEAEIDRIENLIKNLGNIKEKNYFIWEIDFAEIFFAKGGFDIIIGNPPYVRQEEIAPPLIEKEKITIDIKRDYKERLINNIIGINGKDKISKFDRKADYYVYFYFVCLSLLKNNGIFTFINSTSWLDVGYGTFLQEFLLKNFKIIDIHDNQVKRSFKSADINTIIISIQKPESFFNLQDNLVKFIMHKVYFEESLNSGNIKFIYDSNSIINTDALRIYPIKQSELLNEGLEKEEESIFKGKYTGSKWGCKYLKAPDIYFICQEKQKSCEIILNNLFVGERYLNTGGADGFFILTDVQEFDDEYFIIRNLSKEGKEDGSPLFKIKRQFLKLLVKDITKTEKKIIIEKADAWVLNIDTENVDNETKKYIKWGEKVGFNKRSVTKIQDPWYKPTRQMKRSGKILFPRSFNKNHLIYFNPNEFIALRFYRLYPKREIDLIAIVSILNSTYFGMLMELNGPSNLGLGVLDVTMDSFLRIAVPYDEKYNNKLHDAFRKISIRSIGSIYKEIGINPKQPIRSQKLKPLPDRKALDDIVFDILDLSQGERDEVYWAVCELVQNRLRKATSF
nr:Eco57I restriction-modification methylase domain-containing protein [Candidatus Atribacteria bacterium]